MYTQTEKVNIEPKSYLPVFRISQNDVGRTLKAHLVSDEGTIAIPAGATVTMAGIKPSGLGYTVTGIIDGSDVTFETDATMTDEAGQIESEIRIVDGETLIGTTNVVLNVEPNPHPNDTTDGQREPLVNEITALLNQITAQADRVEEYSSKVLNMTVSAHESQEPTVTKTEGEVVNLDFGLPRGEKGERGERGEQGEAGKDGKDGIDGKDGKDGINGVTPDFSIGTVTTLEPTESASVTLTGTEEEPVLNFGIPRGAKGEQGDVSLSDLEKIMVTDTASGAIASFPDGSDLLPALSLVANIVPQQSGSGTPSPENVRPISGWTEVEVFVSPTEDEEDATTHTTDLGRTVYGGTVDLVSGVLTVTHKSITFNGTENWTISGYTGNNQYILAVSDIVISSTLGHVISNRLPEISGADGYNSNNINGVAVWMLVAQIRVSLDISVVNRSAADFKTWLSNNNLQVVYELATPQTYTLTPQTINTLSGVNNVWADSGDVTIEYYADTKLYIDKKLGGS